MANLLKISGPASTLLLAALLAAGARADDVTTAQCGVREPRQRLRRYSTDSDATWLSMSSCDLTDINPDTFAGLPNVIGVFLFNNSIQNINLAELHSPALTKLWLSSNKLRELPVLPHSCPSLTEIRLEYNRLPAITAGAFSACEKIQELALHANHIDYIHPDAFSALTDLTKLYLNWNRISYISDRTFSKNSKLELLYLHDNKITHLPPDFASNLKRTSPNIDTFYFHENPWSCACLLELLADVQRAGVREYFDYISGQYYRGNWHTCVYVDASKYKCRDIRELSTLLFNPLPGKYGNT